MHKRSGISTVPVELLGDIFHHVVAHPKQTSLTPTVSKSAYVARETAGNGSHAPSYKSRGCPLVISHVCRQWREIVVGSANLWTHLQVCLPAHEKVLHLLDLWIQRSKDRSLSLSIHESGAPHDPVDIKTSQAVFRLVFSVIRRWKSIDLSLQTSLEDYISTSLLFTLSSLLPIPLRLESVRILTPAPEVDFSREHSSLNPHGSSRATIALLASMLHQSPVLRTAAWSNVDMEFLCPFEPAPGGLRLRVSPELNEPASSFWGDSLGELAVHAVERDDVLALLTSLSACSELRRLSLHCIQARPTHSNALPHWSLTTTATQATSASSPTFLDEHHLSLHPSTPADRPPDRDRDQEDSTIALPKLESLQLVSFDDTEDLPSLFGAITLPSLRSLQVMDEHECLMSSTDDGQNLPTRKKRWSSLGVGTWCALSDMLQRSDARLDELYVGQVDLYSTDPSSPCGDIHGEIWQPYWP